MAPSTRRTNSRSSSERKHSQLSNKPLFFPSTSGDDSLSSNSEGDSPGSAKVLRHSNRTNKIAERVNSKDSNDLNLCCSDEEDESSEIGSSGISSDGWSETSGCSSSAGSNSSNRDSYRDIEKKLHDSSGDGLGLISNDEMEQDEEDEHNNSSGTALSLLHNHVGSSPSATPTRIVSFDGNVGRETTISPIMMGGSEDVAEFELFDPKYGGSLSDLGIVDSSNNQFYDDSDEDESAPPTANYFDPMKRSKQTREPDPILKPAVDGRPPTPPPPESPTRHKKKSKSHRQNVAIRKSSPEPRKKKYSKVPAVDDSQKKIRDSPTKYAKKKKNKVPDKHAGKMRNHSKREVRESGLTLEDNGFATTVCSFCSDDVGSDIRQCMSCKIIYFCGVCRENNAVKVHQRGCATWRSEEKTSDENPVRNPFAFAPIDAENAIEQNGDIITERGKSGKSSDLEDSKDGQGVVDHKLEAPDIIMCEPIDLNSTRMQELGKDEDDDDQFSFESIPEFNDPNDGLETQNCSSSTKKSSDSVKTKSSEPQRKTVKRAQRSLAYLFDTPVTKTQHKFTEIPEALVEEEAASDEESFYGKGDERLTSTPTQVDKSPEIKSTEKQGSARKMPRRKGNLSEELLTTQHQNSERVQPVPGVSDCFESLDPKNEPMIEMNDCEPKQEDYVFRGETTEVLGTSLSPTELHPATKINAHTSLFLCDFDEDDTTGTADDFHDEPLQQSSNSSRSLLGQPEQHSSHSDDSAEVFHDEPQQTSREISYGSKDFDEKERKRAEAAEKSRKLRRRDRNVIALLSVALICVLMALCAVGGGIFALTYLDGDDQPETDTPSSDEPKSVSQQTQPPKQCGTGSECDFLMGSLDPVFPPSANNTALTPPTLPSNGTAALNPPIAGPGANVTAPTPAPLSPTTMAPTVKATVAPATMVPTANKAANETGSATIELPPTP